MDIEKRKIPALIYSRVVGFYAPTVQWNTSKKAEFEERKMIKIPELKNDSTL